jgi:phage shock protein PspC (stress-responsive transcriptional regulator)
MSEYTAHTESFKRLERTSSRRVIAGVAGGLGRYFNISPAFFRLGFVVLALLGGAGILVYLAALLVIPEEGQERSIVEQAIAGRRERPWALIGLGLVGVALAVLLARSDVWAISGFGWLLVLIAGLAILWTYDAKRGNRRSRILVRGLVALFMAGLAVAVTVIVLAFTWLGVSLGDGTGKRIDAPASIAELKSSYKLGIGNLRVDLSQVGRISRPTTVHAKVGIGELKIVLPPGVPVMTQAHAKAGDIYVLGRHDDGSNASVETGTRGALTVQANVGAGRIDIVRATP